MAIARVGATNASAATLSSPAGADRDIIIWDAYRDTAATIPTLPSGVANPAILSGSGSVNAYLTTFEFCTSASAQSRTFTGATRVVATRYSGVLGIGNAAAGAIVTTSPANFPAVTLLQTGSTSWWKGFGGHKTSTISAPTGMTAIGSGQAGTGPSLTAYDTNGATNSNWALTNVTVTAAAHCTGVIELLGGKSTWSAILKGSGMALSNSNLTVVKSSGATTTAGLGSFPHNGTGKWVYRIDATHTDVSDMSPGLGSSIGMALNTFTDYLGWGNSGNVFVNGSLAATTDIWEDGSNTVWLAFDFDAGLFWGKVSGKNGWNGTGANPDAGTGGISITTVPAQPWPAYQNDQTDIGTLTWDGTATGHGLSTFTPWDSTPVTAAALQAIAAAMGSARGFPGLAVGVAANSNIQAKLRAGASFNTGLTARGASMAKAHSAPSWLAVMVAKATVAAKAAITFSGAVAIAGRAAAMSKATLTANQVVALAARAMAASKAAISFSGTVALGARATGQAKVRAAPSFAVQLAAKASAMAKASISFTGAVALAARATAQASAQLSANAVAHLVARATAMSKATITFSGKVALAARATAQSSAVLSANTVAHLVARAMAMSSATITFTGSVALAARGNAQSSARAGLSHGAALAARATAMAKGSARVAYSAAVLARATIQSYGRIVFGTERLKLNPAFYIKAQPRTRSFAAEKRHREVIADPRVRSVVAKE